MPLSLTDTRVEVLMHHLYVRSTGVTAKEIAVLFNPPMTSRSAQRWLAALVAAGLLVMKGRGHATRYLAPTQRRGRKPRMAPVGRIVPASSGGSSGAVSPPKASPPVVPAPVAPQVAPATPASAAVGVSNAATIAPNRAGELLNALTGRLVTARMAPDRLRPELWLISAQVLRAGESFDELAALVTGELDRMTMDDAVRYGIKPAGFVEWREIYWPAMVVAAPLAPSSAPRPALPSTPSITADRAQHLLGYAPDLVRERITPPALRPWLAKRVPTALRGAETLDDWAALMSAELSRLRLEDCARYDLRPDQFRLWRKTVWPG